MIVHWGGLTSKIISVLVSCALGYVAGWWIRGLRWTSIL
jgi:hypothetical protein